MDEGAGGSTSASSMERPGSDEGAAPLQQQHQHHQHQPQQHRGGLMMADPRLGDDPAAAPQPARRSASPPVASNTDEVIPYFGVTVRIEHCKASGFASKGVDAIYRIKRVFGNSVTVLRKTDPTVTGNFEIYVNDKLVHSKQTLNEGFLDDAHKCEKLFQVIVEAGGTTMDRRGQSKKQEGDVSCRCTVM